MDIGKYELDGAWLEIVVQSDKEIEPFKFKLQPIGSAAAMIAEKSEDKITALCVEAVIGWNLTIGTDPVPCNAETKAKYLSRFAAYEVKTVNGVESKTKTNIALAILDFAGKPDSFLKS